MNKQRLTIRNVYFILSILLVLIIATLHIWSSSLAEVDWLNCFESYGLETPMPRVVDMSFNERFEAVLSEPLSAKIFTFILVLLPFMPILLALFFSKNERTIWIWVTIVIALVVISLILINDPSSVHSCDRKGTNGFWIMLFLNPALFLATAFTTIFVSLFTREKPLL